MGSELWLAERLLILAPLWLCLTVHEWAHAWTAFQLGDDTAKHMGRMTLDPLPHVDPVGTLLLPLLGVPFGWAKPVPVEPNRFDPEVRVDRGLMIVALAGPVSNVLLAAITLAFLRTAHQLDVAVPEIAHGLLVWVLQLNVVLAVFNLLPIYPLDGSRVADALMPEILRPAWDRFCALGFWPLLALLLAPFLLGFSPFTALLDTVAGLAPPPG